MSKYIKEALARRKESFRIYDYLCNFFQERLGNVTMLS